MPESACRRPEPFALPGPAFQFLPLHSLRRRLDLPSRLPTSVLSSAAGQAADRPNRHVVIAEALIAGRYRLVDQVPESSTCFSSGWPPSERPSALPALQTLPNAARALWSGTANRRVLIASSALDG